MSTHAADRVAAWATAVGSGAIALMLTWLIGNRLAALVFEAPTGPVVAISAAVAVAVAVTLVMGRRLSSLR